jgi:hypothetical protein
MQSNQSGRADTFPGQDGAPIPLSDKQGPSETSSTTFELTLTADGARMENALRSWVQIPPGPALMILYSILESCSKFHLIPKE